MRKMKFLSVIGHQDDIDRVIDQYLSRYEIQFENALSELKNVQGLRPFMASNPYREVYQKACELTASLGDVSFRPVPAPLPRGSRRHRKSMRRPAEPAFRREKPNWRDSWNPAGPRWIKSPILRNWTTT